MASAKGPTPSDAPLTASVGPPTPADLRTAVNQIQSLLLLLDSTSDLSQPTSTSGEADLLSAATPRGGTIANLTPINRPEEQEADDAASDSSDAPLMQQRGGGGNNSLPNKPSPNAQVTSQPGLAQMLPALLLPLQPATPALIAQLNMESVAMGFPNIMSRYRGAVQHAFNLVGDLHRGIEMLSNPMPDPANPLRTRQAALSVAGRLMHETPKEQLETRIERVKKRQKLTKDAEQQRRPEEEEPAVAQLKMESNERNHSKSVYYVPSSAVQGIPADATDEQTWLEYAKSIEQHLSQRRIKVRIRCSHWASTGGTSIVLVDLPSVMSCYISFIVSSGQAYLTRVVVRSASEQADLERVESAAGVSTLPLRASRFPAFRLIAKEVFARSIQADADADQDADKTAWRRLGIAILHLAAYSNQGKQ
ncbi:hypothetical protein K437DRAFT_255625 [Tilletiaria anomala UBC 951]|uniref:Uncharacterized protein n=1 Tax=Tilletiaria anomala (strain ATCC 24038 / CBS 436.72 / UBC 951) TaxID=1037660 RepID=A0A066W398_TILAU|nr:uncharacterized protein K437DRAFT_255625 [Tilletiaria anomala UBC 951]KDN48201.1 hypothetical protein K437DRAFT_255625 [Tilletiaria anomala UBC 951]